MHTLDHYLRVMANPSTDIQLANDGLHLLQDSLPSPTTVEKIKAIKKYLSLHAAEMEPMPNFNDLIGALKKKLIHESPNDVYLIQKIKKLPPILKFGFICEQKSLLTNPPMLTHAKKLLIHKTPIIVNRKFLLAHRHAFFYFQIPCRCFHLKGGDLSLIIPESKKTLSELGFNENELFEGSFKEVPPSNKTSVEQDLDRLLTVAIRIGARAGHGTSADKDREGTIGGLPLSQFSKTQILLKNKGVRYCSIDSCHASGSNIAAIEQTPFPVLIASSSEQSSYADMKDPSYNGILDYVKGCLQTHGEPFDAELHERIHEQFKEQRIENAPQVIFPNSGTIAVIPPHHYFQCLQLQNYEKPMILEGNEVGGFISPGGTKNHLLKKVIAKNHTVKGIADQTFSLLDLSNSSTEKGFFIGELECKSKATQVMIFASKKGNQLLYCVPGFFSSEYYFCAFNSTPHKIETASETFALLHYYECFAKTAKSKDHIAKFQSMFFKSANSPLHQMFASLLQAYFEGKEACFNEKLVKELQKSELLALLGFATRLNLTSFVEHAEAALSPPIIKCIKEESEKEALAYIKDHLDELDEKDSQGKTPLFWAIHLDKKTLISPLIMAFDKPAFLEACEKGNALLAEKILRAGGKKLEDLHPSTLFLALKKASKHEELMRDFIYHYHNFKNILSPVVLLLVKNGQHNLLKSFLYIHCEEEDPNSFSADALCLAAFNQDIDSIRILLDKGADPNALNSFGKSPLLYAASLPPNQDQLTIFELLLTKGGDVNLQDKEFDTPFTLALSNRNYPLIATCIKNNGSFSTVKKCGKTLFELGMRDEDLMEVILKHGTLEQIELGYLEPLFIELYKNGNLIPSKHPLFLALETQDFKLASRLKEKGVNVKLKFMSNIFDHLMKRAELSSIEWMLKNGEDIDNGALNILLLQATYHNSLEFRQAALKLIYEHFPSFIEQGHHHLESAFHAYFYHKYIRNNETYGMHKSDKKAYKSVISNTLKSYEKNFHDAIDQVDDFTKVERFTPNQMLHCICQKEGCESLLHDLLNAMIDKCKTPNLKSFYQALKEGHFLQLSQAEIPLCWNYLAPPFLLHSLKNPSKAILLAIKEQMKEVPLSEEMRKFFLSRLHTLCKEYPELEFCEVDKKI